MTTVIGGAPFIRQLGGRYYVAVSESGKIRNVSGPLVDNKAATRELKRYKSQFGSKKA